MFHRFLDLPRIKLKKHDFPLGPGPLRTFQPFVPSVLRASSVTPRAAQSSSKHQLSGSEKAHPAKGFLNTSAVPKTAAGKVQQH